MVRTSEIKRWNVVKWLGRQRIVLFDNKRLSAAENVWKLPQILIYLAIKVTYHRNRATRVTKMASVGLAFYGFSSNVDRIFSRADVLLLSPNPK